MDSHPLKNQDILSERTNLILLDNITDKFSSDCIDLVSSSLNSRILSFSDEFFAPAANLINPRSPIRRPGVFVPSGAWYDGWETRRHNADPFDWVILRLGVAKGRAKGVEVDTSFFDGNHAPDVSVDGCFEAGEEGDERVTNVNFDGWESILDTRKCGPNRRQAWQIDAERSKKAWTHVRLCMYPDGGIARFRLYGEALPVWPEDKNAEIELSAAVMGGMAVQCSDQHFGKKDNLLLPGRGVNMGDGWETKRSREAGHVDWVVVKLGARGTVTKVVIDTAHFRGNFPQGIKIDGMDREGETPHADQEGWIEVLGVQRPGPDKIHEYDIKQMNQNARNMSFTYMKLTIIPDGGVKRFRIFGRRA